MVAVAICLPVYNGDRFLRDALESVLAQTFGDFELIAVDDCSSDSSRAILSEYAQRDPRIRVIFNENNLGLFQNYNRCLNEAKAAFIKPFAQDDILAPTMLEKVVAAFGRYPTARLISTGKRWLGTNGETLKTFELFKENTLVSSWEVITYNLIQLSNWVGEPSTVTFRSEYRGTGFDTTLFHYGDIDYWFRIIEGGDYLYLNDTLCGFRRHEGSATSKNLSGMYFALDVLKMGAKYRTYLDQLGESEQHFAQRAVEQIAMNVDHLVRNESLNLEACLKARPSQMPIDEAAAFKELAFDACRYVTTLLERISALEHQMADQKRHHELQLNDIHQSTSWKLTAPLRHFARARSGS